MKTKKIVCLMLAISLVFVVLMTGCTQGTSETPGQTNSSPPASEVPAEASAGKYDGITGEAWKIGFSFAPTTEPISASFHKALDYCAEQFGCEMVYGDTVEGSADELLSYVQNHIQSGVKAYITVNTSAAMVELLDKNQIYFVVGGNSITDPDTLAMAMESEYYCGSIMADEIQAGYQLAKQVYDAGCKKIAYIALTAGYLASHDDRVRGIEKFAEEHPDMEIITNYRGVDFFQSTGPTEEILAAFPDIDGIICTTNTPTIPAAIYSAGRQKDVKYAAIDYQSNIEEWFNDDVLVGVQVGQYPVMQMAFTVLYEAVSTGNMLIADRSKPLNGSYLWLSNSEDYNNYLKYVEGDILAYTGDELKDMCGLFNTTASLAERQQLIVDTWGSYSLADVVSRHSDLFQAK